MYAEHTHFLQELTGTEGKKCTGKFRQTTRHILEM